MDKLVFNVTGPAGIEPATYGLRVRRSSLAELRARKRTTRHKQGNIELTVQTRR